MRDAYTAKVLATYEARFWSKVRRHGQHECWEWMGHRSPKGYGVFRDCAGVLGPAHRVVYEMEVGDIPSGQVIMHRCDNPPCVNPNHLAAGTARENNADRDIKGRQVAPKGEQHGMATTTEETVRRIRALRQEGHSLTSIGRQCSVSKSVVHQVVSRKTWKHVD